MSAFYIVATPIGNLKDITLRALEILRGVDLILCEDTRVTQKLLARYEIKTPTLSYHQHSNLQKADYVIDLLRQGKNLALVSDAGTPGISDPGNKLIAQLANCSIEQLKIIPIPGVSALSAAASVSGFPTDRFLFLGFPPIKKRRKRFFEEITSSKYPVIFYESPYKIIKTLKELQSAISSSQLAINVVVCRELTKKFETTYRGKLEEIIKELEREGPRGEFVTVVGKEKS